MLPTTTELDLANQDRPHQTVPPKSHSDFSGGGNRVCASLRLLSPLHAHVGMQWVGVDVERGWTEVALAPLRAAANTSGIHIPPYIIRYPYLLRLV